MKKYFLLLFVIAVISGCDKENFNNNNPYIPNYGFSEQINMSLPAYSQLTSAGNGIYYPGGPPRGLIVFYTGTGYNAFDAACPNQAASDCSTLHLNGINADCPCDDAAYSLFTGQCPGKTYPLKQYRVQVNGSVL